MRFTFSLLFISIAMLSFSQDNTTSSKNKLQTTASFSLNSNGMAPVPAFFLSDGVKMTLASVMIFQ